MNIWKTSQTSAFSFIVLNVVEKAVLHFLVNTLHYIKRALRNKQLVTFNVDSLKGKGLIIANLVNKVILHFLITTGT